MPYISSSISVLPGIALGTPSMVSLCTYDRSDNDEVILVHKQVISFDFIKMVCIIVFSPAYSGLQAQGQCTAFYDRCGT